jgi:hypothetical protein
MNLRISPFHFYSCRPALRSPFRMLSLYLPLTNRNRGLMFSWGNGQRLVIESFRGFTSRILYAR